MKKECLNRWEVWKVSAFRYQQKTNPKREPLKRFEDIDWTINELDKGIYFLWNPEVIHYLLSKNSTLTKYLNNI
jgi:hypothetical protein